MTTEHDEIDTANLSVIGIGSKGDMVVMMIPRMQWTKAEALNAAAYLVLCSGDYEGTEFQRVFEAVRNA